MKKTNRIYIVPILVMILSMFVFQMTTGTICVFSATSGIPCPACGMTRAWIALIRGDVIQALYWHPLFFSVPVILFLLLKDYLSSRPAPPRLLNNNRFWIVIFVIAVMVWLIRMILFFPHIPPMNYNMDSYFAKVANLLFGQYFL